MNFIDFFSGAGGMRMGLERAGHACVGFCEFDKFARQTYKAIFNTQGEWESNDIRTTKSVELPKADLWTYGFPCQGISVAGKQKGIGTKANDEQADERSNLFFEIIRLLQGLSEEDRPTWLLCENVKNLLSIDRGFGFARILSCLDEIGYDSEWQVFNTKHSYTVGGYIINGIPQNRERVYIISRFRKRCGRQIFPIARADEQNNAEHQVNIIDAYNRVIKNSNVCGTLTANGGLGLRNCGAFYIGEPKVIDAIYNNRPARITENAPTLRADRQGLCVAEPMPCLTPDREKKRQNGRRFKQPGEPMFTLTAQDKHGVILVDE